MKYTIYFGKVDEDGDGELDYIFDVFESLNYAQYVLAHIEDYLTWRDVNNWWTVLKGDYLLFKLYAETTYEEEKADFFIGSNTYTGMLTSSDGTTNG